jgi:hypothetical protein
MPSRGVVGTDGMRVFAKEMRALSPLLGKATSAALRAIGNVERDKIRSSTAPPFAQSPAEDSQGQPGRKRKTVKTSVRVGGVSLYSLQPDAAVSNWGGTIRPRGVPIKIPRSEFISGQVMEDANEIAAALGELPVELARRYAGFKG